MYRRYSQLKNMKQNCPLNLVMFCFLFSPGRESSSWLLCWLTDFKNVAGVYISYPMRFIFFWQPLFTVYLFHFSLDTIKKCCGRLDCLHFTALRINNIARASSAVLWPPAQIMYRYIFVRNPSSQDKNFTFFGNIGSFLYSYSHFHFLSFVLSVNWKLLFLFRDIMVGRVWKGVPHRVRGEFWRILLGTFTLHHEANIRGWEKNVHVVFNYLYHKVLIYIEHHSVCPLVGIGTPPPLKPQASVPSPPDQRVGGLTRLRLKGWGSPNSNDWRNA